MTSRLLAVTVPFRKCFRIAGPDTVSFLQGLTTNDIRKFKDENIKDRSLYDGFLDSRGRVLFDSLIYNAGDDMLVEYDERIEDKVFAWIKRYILRAKVKITPLHDKIIYSSEKLENSYEDGRTPLMGFRNIGPPDLIPSNNFNQDDYLKLRYRLGIPEGFEEFGISKAVPQEFNLDYLHGIDYRKGCYVGQELVITVHHKGQVRKRILPVAVPSGTSLQVGDEMVLSDAKDSKRAPGKVICAKDNLGLAMIRLSESESSKPHFVRSTDGSPVSVSIPQWFPSK